MRWVFWALLLIWAMLSGCVAATSSSMLPTNTPNGALDHIPLTLLKPDGAGPFPAIAIMHDCSGLGPRSSGSPLRWARELVEEGYVIVMPDSFSTRGYAGGVCTDPSPGRNSVAPTRRAFDAYAALAYLRSLSHVDGARVGIMGGSHGGSTTLSTIAAAERPKDPLAREKRQGFTAAVALYPGCAPFGGVYQATAPLMILIGEKDDWTPAEPCRSLAENASHAGLPVSIKIYPGAHHAFDNNSPVRYVAERVNANSPTGRGATTGGDAQAWADAVREVKGFFARHLKNSSK